jgi:TRAP-type C4-dicarboxylate transport system permease large subunit
MVHLGQAPLPHSWRGQPREVWRTFKAAFWALVMPVLIVSGIRLGVFNVTECSAAAVIYAFVIGKYVYKELSWATSGARCSVRHAPPRWC